jgi:diguanylate cyclase (GGDEF)-like protein
MTKAASSWLRASLQGTTILGVAMIALLWNSIGYHRDVARQAALDAARLTTDNLALTFEEQMLRTIRGIDSTLLVLRAVYEKYPATFDLAEWTWHAGIVSDVVFQYSFIDRNGFLKATSTGPVSPIDLRDREHFRVHVDSEHDEVFISPPLVARLHGKPLIQLSRRILTNNGTFDGVITASLNPARLAKFYETIDIGKDGSISVVGLDGYVRASRGFKKDITYLAPNTGLRAKQSEAPNGSYTSSGSFDGVARIMSYRTVAGLPIFVAVGLSEQEVLAEFEASWSKFAWFGSSVTLLILIVMILSVLHRRRLDRTVGALRLSESVSREKESELRSTLESIDQGIIMVDGQGTIHVINRRVAEMLELPDYWLGGHRKLKDMLTYLRQRGEFENNDFEPRVHEMLMGDGLDTSVSQFERTRPNGTVLEVRLLPTADGGHVRTLTDITERKRNEARIAKLASHDSLTNVANRELFRERLIRALSTSQRENDGLALFYLDLDHFKTVNDTLGHAAGDHVLEEAARRLTACVREHDTVARFGGDEFAVLQAGARTDEEAAQLAGRIIAALGNDYHFEGHVIRIGVSIGIAFGPRDGADQAALVRAADSALYKAKHAGRNCYCFARGGTAYRVSTWNVSRPAA